MGNVAGVKVVMDTDERLGVEEAARCHTFKVGSLADARRYYVDVMACAAGVDTGSQVEFHLYGHRIVCELDPRLATSACGSDGSRTGDSPEVTLPIDAQDWSALRRRLDAARDRLSISHQCRFTGRNYSQMTRVVRDPWGNTIEFRLQSPMTGVLGRARSRPWIWAMVVMILAGAVALILTQSNIWDRAQGQPCTVRGFCAP